MIRWISTDTVGQLLRHQSGIIPLGQSLQSFVCAPDAAQVMCSGTLCCKSCGLKPIAGWCTQIVRPACCFLVEIVTLPGYDRRSASGF